MITPHTSKYEYGILLVNGRYVAETPVEGKSYVMYFSKTGLTTAGCLLHLIDAEGHDPLVRKGWRYHAHCEWGCFYHYTRALKKPLCFELLSRVCAIFRLCVGTDQNPKSFFEILKLVENMSL